MWVVGLASAFASAFACVRWLLRYVATHDFRIFAWYRIAFGMLILLTWQLELVDWSAG
jgi:undecaprenyl-diphosphatase